MGDQTLEQVAQRGYGVSTHAGTGKEALGNYSNCPCSEHGGTGWCPGLWHWCSEGTEQRCVWDTTPLVCQTHLSRSSWGGASTPSCPEPSQKGQCSLLVFSQLQTDIGGNALPFAQPSHGQSSHVGSSPRSVHVFYNKQPWHKSKQNKMKPKHNNLGNWDEKPGTLPASWVPWVLLQTFSSQGILPLGALWIHSLCWTEALDCASAACNPKAMQHQNQKQLGISKTYLKDSAVITYVNFPVVVSSDSVCLLCLTAHLSMKAHSSDIPNPVTAAPTLLSQGRRSGFAATHCTSHLSVLI